MKRPEGDNKSGSHLVTSLKGYLEASPPISLLKESMITGSLRGALAPLF